MATESREFSPASPVHSAADDNNVENMSESAGTELQNNEKKEENESLNDVDINTGAAMEGNSSSSASSEDTNDRSLTQEEIDEKQGREQKQDVLAEKVEPSALTPSGFLILSEQTMNFQRAAVETARDLELKDAFDEDDSNKINAHSNRRIYIINANLDLIKNSIAASRAKMTSPSMMMSMDNSNEINELLEKLELPESQGLHDKSIWYKQEDIIELQKQITLIKNSAAKLPMDITRQTNSVHFDLSRNETFGYTGGKRVNPITAGNSSKRRRLNTSNSNNISSVKRMR